MNPKPNEILVGLRCDLTNLERDTRAQISEMKNNLERDMLIQIAKIKEDLERDMQQRIAAVETHFQSTRSKLDQEIKQLEKDDHSVRQKSDELPGDQVGNAQEASAEKHVNTQHPGKAGFIVQEAFDQ